MMRSELRATVSSGLTRPPTSTGILPNVGEIDVVTGAAFGGSQLSATQSDGENENEPWEKTFHASAVLLRRENPTR